MKTQKEFALEAQKLRDLGQKYRDLIKKFEITNKEIYNLELQLFAKKDYLEELRKEALVLNQINIENPQ